MQKNVYAGIFMVKFPFYSQAAQVIGAESENFSSSFHVKCFIYVCASFSSLLQTYQGGLSAFKKCNQRIQTFPAHLTG